MPHAAALDAAEPVPVTSDMAAWGAEHLDRVWPWLDAALATSPIRTHDKQHVLDGLLSGEFQLWPGPRCACLTMVQEYPTGSRVLFGWLAGGDLEQIKIISRTIEDYARRAGFDGVATQGRRGWLRAFVGYEDAGSTLVKRFR